MLNPQYLEVSELVNNYDGSEKEPIILPALVPNLLLNGTQGVAVGVSSGIPPFSRKSVSALLKRALQEKAITPDWCMKNMELYFPFGGVIHDPERLRLFFSTGASAISILPNFSFDAEENMIEITGGGPYVNDEDMAAKLQEYEIVQKIDNHTEGTPHLKVYLKEQANMPAVVEKLMKAVGDNITLRFNLTERLSPSDPRFQIDENEVEFKSHTIQEYISLWLKWRLDLESRAQMQIAANLDKQIRRHSVLINAIDKLDVLFKILRDKSIKTSAEGAQRISAAFKITAEEGEYLWQRSIGSYAHLSADKLHTLIKRDKEAAKFARSIASAPQDKVLKDSLSLLA
jgi:DNA gyrase subunit A